LGPPKKKKQIQRMPGAASLAWACVDAYLRDACGAAEQNVSEVQEGLYRVEEDEDSGTFDVRIARQRVSRAQQEAAVARWDRLSLLCARIPSLLRNGTVRWNAD
jgi:hypothetical protein